MPKGEAPKLFLGVHARLVFLKEEDQAGVDTEEELWGFALGHPWVHFTPFASFAALREVLCSRINRERKSERVRICGCFSAVCTSTPPPSPGAHPDRVGEGGGVEVQTAEKQPQIRTLSLFRSRFIREHKTSRRAAKEAKGVK
jgi:hypothetical protein